MLARLVFNHKIMKMSSSVTVKKSLESAASTAAPTSDIKKFTSRINTIINFLPAGHEYVIERFGKFSHVAKPGLNVLLPIVDKIAHVIDMRELCIEIDPLTATTEDNVNVQMNGVLYIKFEDAKLAAYGSSRPIFAVSQLAQSIMRTSVGSRTLDVLFRERKDLNDDIKSAIDTKQNIHELGVRINRFEIKDLHPTSQAVIESMALQGVAVRTRRETIENAKALQNEIELKADAFKYQQQVEGQGEYERKKLQADGNAYLIEKQALAEASRIEILKKSLGTTNPETVINLLLSQQYIKEFGNLAKAGTTLVVPQNVSDIVSMTKILQGVLQKN